ncbi:MAG: hypothetical protein ACP5UO_03475 [Thermoplasmata archaeon]
MYKMMAIVAVALLALTFSPSTLGSQAPIAVEGASWYSTNGTSFVAPGYSYVPLFVTFVTFASLKNLNISLNYSSLGGVLQYSYIHGPNKAVRDYFTFPETSAGSVYYIYQLTNISSSAPVGIYEVPVDFSYSLGNATVTGQVNATVPIMGSVRIVVEDAYFGTPGSPAVVTSFSSNVPLTVYLEDAGNSPVTNVTVTFTPQYPLIGEQQNFTIPVMPPYSPIPLTFFASTGPSTLLVNQILRVSYFGLEKNVPFSLRLSGFPDIVAAGVQIGTSSILAAKGMKNVPLTFYLEEDSPVPAVNVSVSFTPSYPLSGENQSTTISALPAFSSVPVTFLSDVTGNGSSFFESLAVKYNESIHIVKFKVILPGYSNLSLVNYFSDPPYIYQGQQFIRITAVLVNGGNSISPPLNVSLTSSEFSILTPPYSFPSIPPGKLLNLTFLVSAGNDTGLQKLYLHVNNRTFLMEERVLSRGNVSFASPAISVVSGSSSNLFLFTVHNTGNVSMEDLQFHILTPDIFSIHIPSSNPLGGLTANNVTFSQLSPGHSITVTFVIDVSSAALPGTYPCQLALVYRTNNSSIPFAKTYNFNVTVRETALQKLSSTTGLTYGVIALAAVIIVVFSIVIIRRRRTRAS